MTPGLFRLFLASLVLVHHSFPLRLGALAVGMFFILSGFWVARMWRSSYSKMPRPLIAFYASRWWRLAPLFVIVQLLGVLSWLNNDSASWPTALGDWRWWITQFTVLGSTQFGRILPPAWSLDVEAQFYLVAPWAAMLIGLFAARQNSKSPDYSEGKFAGLFQAVLALVVFVSLAWSAAAMSSGMSMEAPRIDLYLWLFLMGMLCEYFNWIPSRALAALSAVAFLLLTIGMLLSPVTRSAIWVTGSSDESNHNCSVLYFFVATIVSIPAAISTLHRKSSSWDMWLGDLSYPLYLFHWLPRDWYYTHFDLSQGFARNIPLLAANFAMAFGGAVLLLQVVDRPVQRWRKRWLQARKIEVGKAD